MKLNSIIRLIILFSIIISLSTNIFADRQVISNPQPTLPDIPRIDLEISKTIKNKIGDNAYLFRPHSMAFLESGEYFVFDTIQSKIIKLNSNDTYVTSTGRRGKRLGEFGGNAGIGNIELKIFDRRYLVAFDSIKKSFLQYSLRLELIKEIETVDLDISSKMLLNTKDEMLLFSRISNGSLCFSDLANSERFHIQLDNGNKSFLIRSPAAMIVEMLKTDYIIDSCGDNTYICYFPYSSFLIAGKMNGEKTTKFIWPRELLEYYRSNIIKIKSPLSFLRFGQNLFLNEEDKSVYYIYFSKRDKDTVDHILFAFKYPIKLESTLSFKEVNTDDPIKKIIAKTRAGFYALGKESIYVLNVRSN